MRKYISPIVAIFMGLFMIAAAILYVATLQHYLVPIDQRMATLLFLSIPAILLFIWGWSSIIWAILMRPMLRFSPEADAWVLK